MIHHHHHHQRPRHNNLTHPNESIRPALRLLQQRDGGSYPTHHKHNHGTTATTTETEEEEEEDVVTVDPIIIGVIPHRPIHVIVVAMPEPHHPRRHGVIPP